MPLPQQVSDFAASLNILGAPPQANAGHKIKLRLEPPLTELEALTNTELLARLDLSVVLNKIDLDLTGAGAGAAALEVVLKAVEFPQPADLKAGDVDVGETANRALPYLVPSPGTTTPPAPYVLAISPNVEGLLGKITGSVGALRRVTGKLAGKITGDLVKPAVLPKTPIFTLAWRIEDENGVILTGDRVLRSGPDDAPEFVFLPDFMEAGAPSDARTSPRHIYCHVKIEEANSPTPDTVEKTIGPVTVDVPRVPFPTVMLLTEHAAGTREFPGAVLVAVPGTSVVEGPDQIGTLLEPARQVLQNLENLAQIAPAAFVGAAKVIETVVSTLNSATRIAFVRQDVVPELWHVTRTPGGFLGIGYEGWQDIASSLVLVGPPGRVASLHNRPNTWVGTGAFSVKLGVSGTAVVESFVPAVPTVTPATSTLSIIHSADRGTFNDVVSSYKFWPL